MLKKSILAGLIAAALSIPVAGALAADPAPLAERAEAQQQAIYGSELTTEAERVEYRSSRMRAATTVEERERLRRGGR